MLRSSLFAAALALTVASPALHASGPDDEALRRQMFGSSIALLGDEAFVGEPTGANMVHIYRRTGGSWARSGELKVEGLDGSARFGQSLSADGNTLLVGYLNLADSARGGVHIFTRGSDGRWSDSGPLMASPPARSGFGSAVIVSGDWAFVGAPNSQPGGAVYVFRRSGSAWTAAGMIPSDGVMAGDRFGASLSLDGDRLAVAAPGRDGQKGMVFVFARTNGSWTQEGAVAGRRAPANSQLGTALLLSGDKLWAGAPNAHAFAGLVVGFERSEAGEWSESTTLMPYEAGTSRFGSDLAMVDNELWIGAPFSEGREGRIFRADINEMGGIDAMVKMGSDSIGPNSTFGTLFTVSGNTVAVGMPGDAQGAGTVAFMSRSQSGDWTVIATVFPTAGDQLAAITGREVNCGDDGKAGAFECGNASLLSFMPLADLGVRRGVRLNDNWGWTDPETDREYALVGRTDGTSFVDVTDPTAPRYLGDLPMTPGSRPNVWRDMKVYRNHVYVVADGAGDHGVQVFDLTRLRGVATPQTFTMDAHYPSLGSAHNIAINEETGYAYVVGVSGAGETCGGGLHMIDIREPKSPKFAGCFSDPATGRAGTGYSHDVQCVIYNGPDTKYQGREICIGSNETAISVADVTDKSNPIAVSSASYPDVAYAHQAWFTEDQRWVFLGDELDEGAGKGEAAKGTRTLIWDMEDLDDPILVREFVGTTPATDHNLYIKGNRMYQANYQAGLRILDISDPANPREVGYLDTTPDGTTSQMSGAWSNYPYFKSGTIVVTSVGEGLFLVRDRTQAVP